MKWEKLGLIYGPDGSLPWARHSALQPTPLLLEDKIRIFVGFRDENGVSRVGYVDLELDNPNKVISISQKPVLDIGNPGTFDENGVVPCAIIKRDKELFLYYAGYQLGKQVKFTAFGGLAISKDGGESFQRYSSVPITDRTDGDLYFRVIHSLINDFGTWKTWYGGGSSFIIKGKRSLPVYDIRYMESNDGINYGNTGVVCLSVSDDDINRVGRPYVIKSGNSYKMFYCIGYISKGFRLGYAESDNGVEWEEKTENFSFEPSETGWDSCEICYPSVVIFKEKVYLFYNGNNYGYDGFGCRILT